MKIFFVQLISGNLLVYIIDKCIAAGGYDLYVGINEVTSIVVGMLGLPGVAMLYGLAKIFKKRT